MTLPPELADHFEDPYHEGPLEQATHAAQCECACREADVDSVLMQLRVAGGTIVEAWFEAEGCPWCLGAASFLAEAIEQTPAADTRDAQQRVREAAATAPLERAGCWQLPLRALAAALATPLDEDDGPSFAGPHLGEEQ